MYVYVHQPICLSVFKAAILVTDQNWTLHKYINAIKCINDLGYIHMMDLSGQTITISNKMDESQDIWLVKYTRQKKCFY